MLTIKIGPKEFAAILLFLLGVAVGTGRLLQRIETLEKAARFEHGGLFTGEK